MINSIATDEQTWDDFAIANGGNFLQSWGWARFQESVGNNVMQVKVGSAKGEDEAQKPVAQFTAVRLALPFGQAVTYVARGPVVMGGDEKEISDAHLAVSQSLLEIGRRHGSLFVRVEPPHSISDKTFDEASCRALGWRLGREVSPAHTSIVSLGQSENDLLSALHHKTRYNIRLAAKRGVIVREARYDSPNDLLREDIESFWRLISETAKRDGFSTHAREYYAKMVETLNPSRHKGRRLAVRLVLVEYDGKALAGGLFAQYGDTMIYLHGASSSEQRQVMAPYLMHWEVMRLAKSLGLAKYDFWGIAPPDADESHPWSGITRFKLGFGGERVDYLGTWEMPVNRLGYVGYKFLEKIRGK